jgi:hypothetical protein
MKIVGNLRHGGADTLLKPMMKPEEIERIERKRHGHRLPPVDLAVARELCVKHDRSPL